MEPDHDNDESFGRKETIFCKSEKDNFFVKYLNFMDNSEHTFSLLNLTIILAEKDLVLPSEYKVNISS